MDDRMVELALTYELAVFDGLRQARESLLRLNKILTSGGGGIPKAKMRHFARCLEEAGQIAKDHRP